MSVLVDHAAWELVEAKPIEFYPTDRLRADGTPYLGRLGFPCVRFTLHHKDQKPGNNVVITASNKNGPTVKVVNSLGHEKRYNVREFVRQAKDKYGPDLAREMLLAMLESGIIR